MGVEVGVELGVLVGVGVFVGVTVGPEGPIETFGVGVKKGAEEPTESTEE